MLNSIFGLLLALGILVTVHEYGHFWVARRCGVKVLRFSIGFGRPIWRRTDRHGTEFVIAWIPLGGYVKMLDEREGEVPLDQLQQAFTRKPAWQKIAIALAGPMANFVFAIFAFSLMYMVGTTVLAPIVDQPAVDTAAANAGIERGDRIITIDGQVIKGFSDLGLTLASRVGDSGYIRVEFDRKGQLETVNLPIEKWLADAQSPDPLGSLGLRPSFPEQPAKLGSVEPTGAAAEAGMQVGDLVLTANNRDIVDWMDFVLLLRDSPEQTLDLVVARANTRVYLTLMPKAKLLEDGSTVGYIGVGVEPVAWPAEQLTTVRYLPWQAINKGLASSARLITLSYQMIGKMVTGKVSLKQLGGPISMAQMAGVSIESGFEAFVSFLALISIGLGIMNLLPIPVLDGGHVVIHTIEWITRREMSERMLMIGMQVGLAFIITLMFLVFYNDIGRIM